MDAVEINLNPEEVLVHLRQLGYHNISAQQLREFIRDLKKLIKYDLKKQKENWGSSVELSGSDRPATHPFAQTSQNRYNVGSSAPSSSCSELSCTDSSSFLADTSSEPGTRQKPEKKKPRPSFIRPRDLANNAPPRSDPVALYHYYQQFWKQFKQPGEDDHRQLRWSVREKMMGSSQQGTSRPGSLHRL